MREHYELKHGRPNPYAAKLGSRGRQELVRWWSTTAGNVRLLPPDVAEAFPDTPSTVQALRLVMKLRAIQPEKTSKKTKSKKRSA